MKRISVALVIAAVMAIGLAGVAQAGAKVCTNSMDPIRLHLAYDGEGAPAPGTDPWWDLTVGGITAEGLTLSQAAELFGLDSVDALYEFVLEGILPLDVNGNGILCVKSFPQHQNGTPLYLFLVGDDKHNR